MNDDDPVPDGESQMWIVQWFAALLAIALIISLVFPVWNRRAEVGSITKDISNCRQILIALQIYAADHNGEYPKGETANQAFRELFKEDIIDAEQIFGSRISPYTPDGVINVAPQ